LVATAPSPAQMSALHTSLPAFSPPPPLAPEVMARDSEGRITLRAPHLAEPIVLDGKLDDPAYSAVKPVTGFTEQEPDEGEPASEETEAWLFFDDRNFYVGVRCWDSHPERMIANEMRRDHMNILRNENVTLVLDTYYDRRNGFQFQVNLLGALRDVSVGDEGQSNNNDWNTVWDAKTSKFDQGWTVEMAIPFNSLRFKDVGAQVWSLNVRRMVIWKNETSFLAPIAAAHNVSGVYRFSDAATLVGVEVPGSNRNLELKPYAISSLTTNQKADEPFANDPDADFGFDVKYGLTSALIGDFTYNTDFAQVEEDQQQINLTRFNLLFPEKRDFFLEGQSIFAFGGASARGAGGAQGAGAAERLPRPVHPPRDPGAGQHALHAGRAGALRHGAGARGARDGRRGPPHRALCRERPRAAGRHGAARVRDPGGRGRTVQHPHHLPAPAGARLRSAPRCHEAPGLHHLRGPGRHPDLRLPRLEHGDADPRGHARGGGGLRRESG